MINLLLIKVMQHLAAAAAVYLQSAFLIDVRAASATSSNMTVIFAIPYTTVYEHFLAVNSPFLSTILKKKIVSTRQLLANRPSGSAQSLN